jgi:hypothetical protein
VKKTENHFSPYPRCTQGSKSKLLGKLAILPAYGRLLNLEYFCKAAGQGCWAKVQAMVQYAQNMVKLDNNAVF